MTSLEIILMSVLTFLLGCVMTGFGYSWKFGEKLTRLDSKADKTATTVETLQATLVDILKNKIHDTPCPYTLTFQKEIEKVDIRTEERLKVLEGKYDGRVLG